MSNSIDTMTQQYLQIAGRAAETSKPDKAADGAVPAGKVKTSAKDVIQLTDTARRMQALEERLANLGEVDQSKVDAVRSRIESGDYEVSSERVANKMLAMDRSIPDDK